jgi:hypothetical protein
MQICHQCRKPVNVLKLIGRKDTCPFCNAELRCCLNCRFYDARVYNQCRESQAERVLEKDRSNFCEYFVYGENISESDAPGQASAKDKLESLFRK